MDIELRIAAPSNYESAFGLYKDGGFSHSYAEITLSDPQGLRIPLDEGTLVEGISNADNVVTGKVMKDLDIGEVDIPIRYTYPPYDKTDATTCVVGSLPSIGIQVVNGCLKNSGTVYFGASRNEYHYSYNDQRGNQNELTLQKLSSMAEELMLVCDDGCPHNMFYKYFRYYKVPDFGDRWATAAFNLTKTVLYRGNVDFSRYKSKTIDRDAQTEAIKIGTLFLNVWIYITYKMDLAVNSCDHLDREPDIASWDAAYALFTGSLDHVTKDSNHSDTKITKKGKGHMLHALADQLCSSFGTCESENGLDGPSSITVALLRGFRLGQEFLTTRECRVAQDVQRVMQNAMVVPLIQGLLLHTYERIDAMKVLWSESRNTAYAAAVLPVLHSCNENDAEIVRETVHRKGKLTMQDFRTVKEALEQNYACLGVTCVDVGGVWDHANERYMEGATACSSYGSYFESGGRQTFSIVVLSIIVIILTLVFVVWLTRRQGKCCWKKKNYTEEVPLTSHVNNRNII